MSALKPLGLKKKFFEPLRRRTSMTYFVPPWINHLCRSSRKPLKSVGNHEYRIPTIFRQKTSRDAEAIAKYVIPYMNMH